ncbi:hypothetical protein SLS60_002467 [Paraconiothyrium brasiliense]|uniref:Uncharacterized protein n=1 Tax=Paraconiothyrium brasiliense TaxID=300254 RepID=A0ABR3S291_9PLEO
MLSTTLSTTYLIISHIIVCVILIALIALFVHEPTFQAFHETLFYMHVVARFGFQYLRLQIRYATLNSTDFSTWLASCARGIFIFAAPVLRPILPWASRLGTHIIHFSLHFLCYVDGAVVEVGKYVVDLVAYMGKDARELKDMWRVAGKEVAEFCNSDSKIWAAIGF